MRAEPYVIWLADCTRDCLPVVGGKAIGLGTLVREGFQVPAGFAISTSAYREHIDHNGLAGPLQALVTECTSLEAQKRASEEIRQLFEASRPSPRIEDEVLAAYARLCGDASAPVAVRSSATAEDLADASFAGQQETYLWILGGAEVLEHIVRCWASLFTPQAIAYRGRPRSASLHGVNARTRVTDLAMGVVVQQMVPAEAAGVMFTIDPVTGDPSGIVVEAAYGLGAAVVNGEVTPDRVCVDKVQLEIRSRTIGTKALAYRFDPAVQGTRLEEVPPLLQTRLCLTDDEVIHLAALGKKMELAMGRAQDMEWAIGAGRAGPREVFLLQARPETVWSQKPRRPLVQPESTVMDRILQAMRVPRPSASEADLRASQTGAPGSDRQMP